MPSVQLSRHFTMYLHLIYEVWKSLFLRSNSRGNVSFFCILDSSRKIHFYFHIIHLAWCASLYHTLYLSLTLNTDKHKHTHVHTYTHTYKHTQTQTYTHRQTHILTQTQKTQTQTNTLAHTHTFTNTHTHSNTNKHTGTYTHIHKHSLKVNYFSPSRKWEWRRGCLRKGKIPKIKPPSRCLHSKIWKRRFVFLTS